VIITIRIDYFHLKYCSRLHLDLPDGTATLGDLMRLQDSILNLLCATFLCLPGSIFFSGFVSLSTNISGSVLVSFLDFLFSIISIFLFPILMAAAILIPTRRKQSSRLYRKESARSGQGRFCQCCCSLYFLALASHLRCSSYSFAAISPNAALLVIFLDDVLRETL
jgi:hypothetical protein